VNIIADFKLEFHFAWSQLII